MNVSQAVFTLCRLKAEEVFGNNSVYTGAMPPSGTDYPFITVAYQDVFPMTTKADSIGIWTVNQTLRAYSDDPDKRGILTNLLEDVSRRLVGIKILDNYRIALVNHNYIINSEDSENEKLLHGRIELEFRVSLL